MGFSNVLKLLACGMIKSPQMPKLSIRAPETATQPRRCKSIPTDDITRVQEAIMGPFFYSTTVTVGGLDDYYPRLQRRYLIVESHKKFEIVEYNTQDPVLQDNFRWRRHFLVEQGSVDAFATRVLCFQGPKAAWLVSMQHKRSTSIFEHLRMRLLTPRRLQSLLRGLIRLFRVAAHRKSVIVNLDETNFGIVEGSASNLFVRNLNIFYAVDSWMYVPDRWYREVHALSPNPLTIERDGATYFIARATLRWHMYSLLHSLCALATMAETFYATHKIDARVVEHVSALKRSCESHMEELLSAQEVRITYAMVEEMVIQLSPKALGSKSSVRNLLERTPSGKSVLGRSPDYLTSASQKCRKLIHRWTQGWKRISLRQNLYPLPVSI